MRCMAHKRLSTSAIAAGAAAFAALSLFGAAPSDTDSAVASGSSARIIPVNDDDGWSVNDQGQDSGDIFLQNAQDQSTA